jgi:hypothetical protein
MTRFVTVETGCLNNNDRDKNDDGHYQRLTWGGGIWDVSTWGPWPLSYIGVYAIWEPRIIHSGYMYRWSFQSGSV